MAHPGVDPALLVAHAEGVRRLARALVADAHRAEDVAQETMRIALERRPREGWALASWLAGVARNVARLQRRGEARRVARERAAARGEALPSTLDVAARMAAQRAALDAVAALEEPYKTVVVLRFFEDLPPRRISQRLGVPVETVRTRLKRALDRLRTGLDARHGGDGRRWLAVFVPLGGGEAGRAIRRVLGGLLMTATPKAAAVAALLILATVAATRTWWHDPSADGATSPAAVADASPSVAARGERPGTQAGLSGRRPKAAAVPTGEHVLGEGRIGGFVVDEAGAPVAGAQVAIASADPPRRAVLGPDAASISTGPDGWFETEALEGMRAHVVAASTPRHGLATCPAAWPGSAVRLVLPAGSRLWGRVLGPSGAPVTSARVAHVVANARAEVVVEAVSDAEGVYRLEGLPDARQGTAGLVASAEGFAPWSGTPPPLAPSREVRFDVDLEVGFSVHGRVLDAETGEGIEGATVTASGWADSRDLFRSLGEVVCGPLLGRRMPTTKSGQGGSYRLEGLPTKGRGIYVTHGADVTLNGYVGVARDPRTDSRIDALPRADLEIDLRLWPAGSIEGRVVGPSGAPVAGADVSVWGGDGAFPKGAEPLLAQGKTDAEGRFRIEDVGAPRERAAEFRVSARAYGLTGRTTAGVRAGRTTSDVVVRLAATDRDGPPLRGEVLFADGMPATNVRVEARTDATWIRVLRTQPDSETRTDGRGRFVLARPRNAKDMCIQVDVHVSGFVPVAAFPGRSEEGLRLVLRTARTIEGRVTTASGAPAAGAHVAVYPESWTPPTSPPQAVRFAAFTEGLDLRALASRQGEPDPCLAIARCDPDGKFRLEELTSENVLLVAWLGAAFSASGRVVVDAAAASCQVRLPPEAPAVPRDVVLTLLPPEGDVGVRGRFTARLRQAAVQSPARSTAE